MAARTLYLIAGLPRAGSTLTAALSRQNPRCHARMANPIAALFEHLTAQVSAASQLSAMTNATPRARPQGLQGVRHRAPRAEQQHDAMPKPAPAITL